jgi:hypothetical protein
VHWLDWPCPKYTQERSSRNQQEYSEEPSTFSQGEDASREEANDQAARQHGGTSNALPSGVWQ